VAESTWVFDTWPLMAYFTGQPASGRVRELIREAHATATPLRMTAVNLGEVWYSIARTFSESDADATVEHVRSFGFQVHDADWDLTREAARLKARYRLSYADCFAAALARQLEAVLFTGDQEFQRLEQEVRIRWL